jgi:Ser/Thr protein kinase RdoA (MazF antagonist)
MNTEKKFQKRISYAGDLAAPLRTICADYELGDYTRHEIVVVGYEDFNVVLHTTKSKFFVKFFGNFRTDADCERYVTIIRKTIEAGVREPILHESSQGFIYRCTIDGAELRLIVMEHIDGKTFYDLNKTPAEDEARETVRQAALINSVKHKPKFIYDSWAIPSFLKEYNLVETLLPPDDLALVRPLVNEFKKARIDDLPHALVHGDIIKTNVILSADAKVYIIDFAVANYYPRIQELAVILCNMLFDENHPEIFKKYYTIALDEYQKILPLDSKELSLLPLFIKVAHAMHVVGAVREEKIRKNLPSAEDNYWLKLGRIGLAYMLHN